MNVTSPINVESARHRVVTILRITAGCVLIASVTLYHHVRETRRVDGELAAAQLAIRARKQQYMHRSLAQQIAEAEQRNQQLRQAWEQHRLQVDTFHGTLPERARVAAGDDARIDFKVALFNARETLQELAQANGVKLTDDLGIAETIGTEDDTERRLWELGSVVRLVELLVASGVHSIETIAALPPFVYAEVADENEYTLAFPVRVSLQCTYAQLLPLLNALSQKACFYAISQCDISRPSMSSGNLRVQLVCSAMRFLVGAVDDLETGNSTSRRGGRG
jgi:HAMP domain-containing protein